MGVIANLAVSLTAKTAAFTLGMKSAAKDVTNFTSSVSSVMGKLSAIGGAVSAVVGAASVGILVKNSMEAIDATGKLAESIGVVPEKLIGLQHAAAMADVSQEDLNKALQKTMRTFGSADAFDKIADMIARTSDAGMRAKIAFAAFGKSGQNLIPMLMGGSAGLREMQAEAVKLGISFSAIDYAKIDAANDSFDRVKAMITGVANQVAIGLAPMLESATMKLVAFGMTGEGIGAKTANAMKWVASAVGTVGDGIYLVESAVSGLETVFQSVAYGIKKAMSVVMEPFLMIQQGIAMISGNDQWVRSIDKQRAMIEASTEKSRNKMMEAAYATIDQGQAGRTGRASKQLDRVLADADKKAKAAEKAAAGRGRLGGALADSELASVAKGQKGGDTFKQMSTRRFAIAGVGGASRQEVGWKKGENLLTDIRNLLANQGPAEAVLG